MRHQTTGVTWVLFKATVLVVTVVAFGTIGFIAIERWNFVDSLYMTVSTLATVGFGEVHPLSAAGRLFACLLIFVGVGVAVYCFTLVGRMIVEGELNRARKFYLMQKRIATFTDHTIVCGYGRLARNVIPELQAAGQNVVVIENASEEIQLIDASGTPYVEGNAYEEETLERAGIGRAKSLLAFLPKDADNVYITLCARELNPSINIIARAESDIAERKLRQAGANLVVAPQRIGAARVAQRLLRPYISDFLELAVGRSGTELVLEEIVVPAASACGGKTLDESGLRTRTGVIVAAIIGLDGQMEFNPTRETRIQPGSTMIVLGRPASVQKLTELLVEG